MADNVNQNRQPLPSNHNHNKPNYYFLFVCMAGLAISIITTLAYMAAMTSWLVNQSLATAATISLASASTADIGPIGALILVGAGICLLPFLVAGCFDTRIHVHGSSDRMFHHHHCDTGYHQHDRVIVNEPTVHHHC